MRVQCTSERPYIETMDEYKTFYRMVMEMCDLLDQRRTGTVKAAIAALKEEIKGSTQEFLEALNKIFDGPDNPPCRTGDVRRYLYTINHIVEKDLEMEPTDRLGKGTKLPFDTSPQGGL